MEILTIFCRYKKLLGRVQECLELCDGKKSSYYYYDVARPLFRDGNVQLIDINLSLSCGAGTISRRRSNASFKPFIRLRSRALAAIRRFFMTVGLTVSICDISLLSVRFCLMRCPVFWQCFRFPVFSSKMFSSFVTVAALVSA